MRQNLQLWVQNLNTAQALTVFQLLLYMLLSVNPKLFLLTVRPHLLNSSLIIAITDHPVPKFNHICVKYHRIKKKKKNHYLHVCCWVEWVICKACKDIPWSAQGSTEIGKCRAVRCAEQATVLSLVLQTTRFWTQPPFKQICDLHML